MFDQIGGLRRLTMTKRGSPSSSYPKDLLTSAALTIHWQCYQKDLRIYTNTNINLNEDTHHCMNIENDVLF